MQSKQHVTKIGDASVIGQRLMSASRWPSHPPRHLSMGLLINRSTECQQSWLFFVLHFCSAKSRSYATMLNTSQCPLVAVSGQLTKRPHPAHPPSIHNVPISTEGHAAYTIEGLDCGYTIPTLHSSLLAEVFFNETTSPKKTRIPFSGPALPLSSLYR
jgi:hypothetical protein